MRRIVITGATGVIGMALINKCIEMGDEVLVLCNAQSARSKNIPKAANVRVVQCSMKDYALLNPDALGVKTGYDVFYHFAWACTSGAGRNDLSAQEENIKYTLEAVKLASKLGCKTFVGAGSQAEYGRYECDLNENMMLRPENGYGAAKAAASMMSRLLCNQLGIKHIWTRVLSVYGPYDGPNTMISSIVCKLLKNEDAPMTAGEQIWDYLYSDDAAKAFYLLSESGVDGETYLIASGKSKSLIEYAKAIEKCVPSEGKIIPGAVAYSDKQVMHLGADISKLKKDTGFEPEVDFEEGIRRTAEYIKTIIGQDIK